MRSGAVARRARRPRQTDQHRIRPHDTPTTRKQTAVFEGNVVLTQGTLIIRADKLTVRQDKDGFQYGIAIGKPATFRQKRDGADEYIDGEAERIEYDGKHDQVELFNRARLTREQRTKCAATTSPTTPAPSSSPCRRQAAPARASRATAGCAP